MKRTLVLLGLALATLSSANQGWYKVQVSVPDPPTLQRLQDTDLVLLDCVPHLGTADVAVTQGDMVKLLAGGFRFTYVRPLEDPSRWIDRHARDVNVQTDDYRLHYFTADQILAFFEDLRANNPVYVSRRQIGVSINGEPIWAYRFGRPLQQGTTPINNFIVEGLIHAREWITGSVVMHVAKQCVLGLTTPQPTPFLPNQAVWIIPISNPDGYRYTWTNNRLWRKNRRNNGGGVYGVDLNRNYAKGWGGSGSSGTPSSETYRGTAAFSEPETAAVRDFAASLTRVGGFMDFHSYSQIILWPWGYTTTAPPDQALFNSMGIAMQGVMNQFGVTYSQGQTARVLYIASGTSNDYIYDVRKNPAFAIELRDTGQYGFELPEGQIFASQDEAWAGLKKMLSYIPS